MSDLNFSGLFSASGEHNAPLDTSGMVEGSMTVSGHIPGTDPATDLALFADGLELAGDQPFLAAAVREVLAELSRARRIEKAATALVATIRPGAGDRFYGNTWTGHEPGLCGKAELDALAEEVRGER